MTDPVEGLKVSEAQASVPSPNAIGGGSEQIFMVEALRPGSYSLRFHYKRPWEQRPEDTAEFHIVAKKA